MITTKLPVLTASGKQRRFELATWLSNCRMKLVYDKTARAPGDWTKYHFVFSESGIWVRIWVTRLDTLGRRTMQYEFASDGRRVIQHDNWNVIDNRGVWSCERGGISQTDLAEICKTAREFKSKSKVKETLNGSRMR